MKAREIVTIKELKKFFEEDGYKLCSREDRRVMAGIVEYMCEFDVITFKQKDELFEWLGID